VLLQGGQRYYAFLRRSAALPERQMSKKSFVKKLSGGGEKERRVLHVQPHHRTSFFMKGEGGGTAEESMKDREREGRKRRLKSTECVSSNSVRKIVCFFGCKTDAHIHTKSTQSN